MLKWIPHVAGNINRLNFQRAKITNFAGLVISTKNNINVTSRATFRILQTNFCKCRPSCTCRKKEIRRVVRNYPFLTKTNRTSNDYFIVVKHAAYTERVLGFVLRAIRNFVVKRAKTFCAMAIRFGAHVSCRKSENFCKWMEHFCHGRSLRGKFISVNPRSSAVENCFRLQFQKPHHGVAVLEHLHFRPRRDDFQCVTLRVAENKSSAGREQLRQIFIVEQLLRE